jgi:hypothetical protein
MTLLSRSYSHAAAAIVFTGDALLIRGAENAFFLFR